MINKEVASFRDPSGYIYYENGKVYRKILPSYFREYKKLMSSGLYDELVDKGFLVAHKEIKNNAKEIIIEVDKIPYISYPYEWTFGELKVAALLTLSINQISMKYGMILKDASAYNVQFVGTQPIFIDTLSFMFYHDDSPWGAYGQFSRHFIAPLVLMKYKDVRLNTLLKNYIDGIPLDLCSNILDRKGSLIGKIHIKMQSKSIEKHNLDGRSEVKSVRIKKQNLLNMFQMIERQINGLKLRNYDTEWKDYYNNSNYNKNSFSEKEKIIVKLCKNISLKDMDIVFDLGANDGRFSKLVNNKFKSYVVSLDIDSNSVEYNYLTNQGNNKILPLIMDFTNPSSGIGFASMERKSFLERGKANLTMVLAFIHHLAISNNLSFEMIADFLSKITKYLIIEFVPKEDSQVALLLKTREDIFVDYNIDNFKKVFTNYFSILSEEKILGSERTLFLMEVKK